VQNPPHVCWCITSAHWNSTYICTCPSLHCEQNIVLSRPCSSPRFEFTLGKESVFSKFCIHSETCFDMEFNCWQVVTRVLLRRQGYSNRTNTKCILIFKPHRIPEQPVYIKTQLHEANAQEANNYHRKTSVHYISRRSMLQPSHIIKVSV